MKSTLPVYAPLLARQGKRWRPRKGLNHQKPTSRLVCIAFVQAANANQQRPSAKAKSKPK